MRKPHTGAEIRIIPTEIPKYFQPQRALCDTSHHLVVVEVLIALLGNFDTFVHI